MPAVAAIVDRGFGNLLSVQQYLSQQAFSDYKKFTVRTAFKNSSVAIGTSSSAGLSYFFTLLNDTFRCKFHPAQNGQDGLRIYESMLVGLLV